MSPTGEPIKVVGTQGKGVGPVPGGSWRGDRKDGTIYIVDQYNNRLSAYDRNGIRKWIISTGSAGNEKPVASSVVATTSQVPPTCRFRRA